MEKVKKVFVIFIGMFLAICQINSKVNAYTLEEVKEKIDFKIVQEDGEPENYDVLIDANDLISSEKLPCIESSLDTVLYGDADFLDLLDIDFLNINSSNENEIWTKLSEIVRSFFRVFYYIGLAAMLTLLIYLAVILVYTSISKKESVLPFGKVFKGGKGKNPQKDSLEKRFIEQWLISFFILVCLPYILNFVIFFSNFITEISDQYVTEEAAGNSIVVYVKNSKVGTSSTSISNMDSLGTVSVLDGTKSGELRQKVIDQANTLNNLGVPGGYCEMWVEHVYETALGREIPNQCCAHNAGINSIVSTSMTDIIPGAAVFSYRSSSGTIDSSCGQDAGHVGIYVGNGQIVSCTGGGSTGIVVTTLEEWQQSWEFSGWGWLPGLEDLADGATPLNSTVTTMKTSYIDYYFKTNLEGLLMFQSQYDWEEYAVQNVVNIIAGIFITIFKIFLYGILLVRMAVVAILTVIAPILVLMNAFMRINGNKEFLKNWLIVYLYFALLTPVIALIYYILARTNVYEISESPFYILLIIILMFILIIASLKKVFKNFTDANKKNMANKKV